MELPTPTISENTEVRMTTRSMNDICKPKKSFLVTKHPLPFSLEPSSVTAALIDSRWREAMSSELTALMHHNTWQLVPPPTDCNIVGCKWVFQVKRHANGSVNRFKAKLVAKGFNQRPGLDYKETFSPVVK
jgi:histone deacetylase 1/2